MPLFNYQLKSRIHDLKLEGLIENDSPLLKKSVVSLYCKCTIPNLNYGKGEDKDCNNCNKPLREAL